MDLRVALMLAMSLLCAQWAAQAHAYSHLSSRPAATLPQELKSQPCTDCLSFAPLLAAAAASSLPAPAIPRGAVAAPASVPESLISRGFPAAFRSRAPPHSC
jgi:hypothetical protein